MPAISFDHVDVSTLLKIATLRKEVKSIKEAYATVEQLNCMRSEVDYMKYASVIDMEHIANINKRRGGYLLESSRPIGTLNLLSTPHQRERDWNKRIWK